MSSQPNPTAETKAAKAAKAPSVDPGKSRIAFFVNNGAYDDNRVRKTAEVLSAKGYDCTVYGIAQAPDTFRINGVSYRLLAAKRGVLRGFLAGIAPQFYLSVVGLLARPPKFPASSPIQQQASYTQTAPTQTAPTQTGPTQTPAHQTARTLIEADASAKVRDAQLGLTPGDQQAGRLKTGALDLYRLALGCIRIIKLSLQPQRSTIGAVAMFGNYIRSLLPAALNDNAAILYCHELWTLPIGALAASRNNACLIYDSHEFEAHRNNNWSERSNAVRIQYEKRYISKANRTTTVCQSIADELATLYSLDRTGVVPNAPIAQELVCPALGLKDLLRLTQANTPLLVYTGKLTTGRGLHDCIQILKHLPQYHLAMVGPRVANIALEIAQLSTDLGLQDRVHLVDAVPPEMLVDFISDADVSLIPIENVCLSYYYSLPNKIFEAAMAGLPIVTSKLPELEQFAATHHLGKACDFSQWETAADTIASVIANGDLYNNSAKALELRQKLNFEHAFHDWPQIT